MTWCRREEGAGSPQDMTEEGSVWWSEGGAGVGESPQIGLEVRGEAFTRTGTERRKGYRSEMRSVLGREDLRILSTFTWRCLISS